MTISAFYTKRSIKQINVGHHDKDINPNMNNDEMSLGTKMGIDSHADTEVEAEAEVDMEDAVEAVVEVAEETTMIQLTYLVYHPESISKTCHSRMRDGMNLPRNKSLQYGH